MDTPVPIITDADTDDSFEDIILHEGRIAMATTNARAQMNVSGLTNESLPQFYTHKGYLLTALWQNQANVLSLSERTGVDNDVLTEAVKNFEIDLVDLASMCREDDEVELGNFLERAGMGPEALLEMQPMPGINLDEMDAEKQAEMCRNTTRCPLCNEGVKESSVDFHSDVFFNHTFMCMTTLDRHGNVTESKKCARRQKYAQRRAGTDNG